MKTPSALALVLGAASLASAEQPAPHAWPGAARAAVALTYDDGLDLHLDHAAPDLDAVGLKGTFYVPGHSYSLASRLPEWRALALRGHELGNHALFHPCLKDPPGGGDRDWVRPEYALEGYSVAQMANEARIMNTLLSALDGEGARTFAYNCTETTAGGESYVDALRPLFLAARVGGDAIVEDVGGLDPMLVPSWAVEEASGAEMVAFVEQAVAAGGMAVFMFHGVGGGYLKVSREAHRELLAWLDANRDRVWTDTFLSVMRHAAGVAESPEAPEVGAR
jgi:hypothetical protein